MQVINKNENSPSIKVRNQWTNIDAFKNKMEMLIEIILFYSSRLYLISISYSVQNNEYLWY